MEMWETMRARRNVRRYTDQPISVEDLDRILEAGRITPSSMNEQPWDFIVCTDRNILQGLADTWKYARHIAGSAVTVVLVAPITSDPDDRDWIIYDMGQVTMHMMLAAADLGVGSSHAAIDDQALARKLLALPDDRFVVGLIALGYPADRPLAPVANHKRRAFEDVVHRERW